MSNRRGVGRVQLLFFQKATAFVTIVDFVRMKNCKEQREGVYMHKMNISANATLILSQHILRKRGGIFLVAYDVCTVRRNDSSVRVDFIFLSTAICCCCIHMYMYFFSLCLHVGVRKGQQCCYWDRSCPSLAAQVHHWSQGTECSKDHPRPAKGTYSLVSSLHTPPAETRSGEQSRIPWAYSPKVVRTNESASLVIITRSVIIV